MFVCQSSNLMCDLHLGKFTMFSLSSMAAVRCLLLCVDSSGGGGEESEENALDNEGDGTYKSISLTSQGPATWPAGDGVNG